MLRCQNYLNIHLLTKHGAGKIMKKLACKFVVLSIQPMFMLELERDESLT